MIGLKKPQFKSKKDAYGAFISNITTPFMVIGFGIYAVLWYRDHGGLTYDQAKQSIYFIIVCFLLVSVYSGVKVFHAFFAIMRDDFGNAPETVICLQCREPFLFSKVNDFKCPKCGGELENLEGFYDRHPEMKNENK